MTTPLSSATAGPLPAMGARQTIATIREFRDRLLSLVADLDDRQLIGPRLAIVNPPLWEIGHVAWTQEFWLLRHLYGEKPIEEHGDRLYNSTDVAHDTRWELLLPSRNDTLRYMNEVLERCCERIAVKSQLAPEEFYFYWLTTFHEGMHAEALAYTRQTLGYPAPVIKGEQAAVDGGARPGDVEIPGGKYLIGATKDIPFVFDNEKWAHEVMLKLFRIAQAPVTNGEFLEFVEEGGYRERRHWSEEGWRWLESGGAPQLEKSFAKFFNRQLNETTELQEFSERFDHPVYWQREANGRWLQRIYDRYFPLNENLPIVHVSWYEAEAYCNWSGRRLPTEAEWEVAASVEPNPNCDDSRRHFPWGNQSAIPARANLDWRTGGIVEVGAYAAGDSAFGCHQMLGNVWEWTASNFQPYSGFSAYPNKEYSKT